jgi:hypothetical protein
MWIQVEGVDSVSSLNIEWEREARPAEGALAARGVARGLTHHSTGARVSGFLIVELAVAVLSARPVNSSVRWLFPSNLLVLEATSRVNFSCEI